MQTLPVELLPLIVEFQPFFSKSVWENAQVLLIGAILAILIALPVVLATRGPDALAVYLIYNAVVGCLVFAHGAVNRGRYYAMGLLWMSQNLLLPFLPPWGWAALHAVVGSCLNLWSGLTSWQAHRAGQARQHPAASAPST